MRMMRGVDGGFQFGAILSEHIQIADSIRFTVFEDKEVELEAGEFVRLVGWAKLREEGGSGIVESSQDDLRF